MTRPVLTVTSLLKSTISPVALDFTSAPKVFAVQLDTHYGDSREGSPLGLAPSLKTPLSFLAWVQLWLRLVLGLETAAESLCEKVGAYAVPVISYQQVQPEALNKPAAHNLEALMRFAPDGAGWGLTLNQYRERFTRLSVVGRVKLYRALATSIFRRGHLLSACCVSSVKSFMVFVPCYELLRPD